MLMISSGYLFRFALSISLIGYLTAAQAQKPLRQREPEILESLDASGIKNLDNQEKGAPTVFGPGPIVYKRIEKMPTFRGDLAEFLTRNLRYPDAARKYHIEGRVVIQFKVMPDGSIDSARVSAGVNEYLDAEALRVIRLMPKWNPGRNEGKPIEVNFTLPLTFKLD